MKELRPELIATYQGECKEQHVNCSVPHSFDRTFEQFAAGDVRVFEGHAFIVEAAVSIGGRDVKPGINVHRFANRIPLLFEV